jgi:hypothetical protein
MVVAMIVSPVCVVIYLIVFYDLLIGMALYECRKIRGRNAAHNRKLL